MTETANKKFVVVVGIDYSGTGERALSEAVQMAAERSDSELHIVHVAAGYGPMLRLDLPDDVRTVSLEEAESYLAAYAAKHCTELDPSLVKTHVQVGTASDELVAKGKELEADLMVVGTHGRTGVRRLLLGSVAEAVVRGAGCPVLVVRPKDYPEPKEA